MHKEQEYWKKREEHHPEEFEGHASEGRKIFTEQEYRFREALGQIDFAEVETVLQIGCESRCVTGIVLEKTEAKTNYVAIDIDAERAEATRKSFGCRVRARTADFITEKLQPSDLVLASEVFLQFPPDRIQSVLHKAQRLSKKYLIHIDPSIHEKGTTAKKRSPRHPSVQRDWMHNYPEIYDYSRIDRITTFPVDNARNMIYLVKNAKESGNRMPKPEKF